MQIKINPPASATRTRLKIDELRIGKWYFEYNKEGESTGFIIYCTSETNIVAIPLNDSPSVCVTKRCYCTFGRYELAEGYQINITT